MVEQLKYTVLKGGLISEPFSLRLKFTQKRCQITMESKGRLDVLKDNKLVINEHK